MFIYLFKSKDGLKFSKDHIDHVKVFEEFGTNDLNQYEVICFPDNWTYDDFNQWDFDVSDEIKGLLSEWAQHHVAKDKQNIFNGSWIVQGTNTVKVKGGRVDYAAGYSTVIVSDSGYVNLTTDSVRVVIDGGGYVKYTKGETFLEVNKGGVCYSVGGKCQSCSP